LLVAAKLKNPNRQRLYPLLGWYGARISHAANERKKKLLAMKPMSAAKLSSSGGQARNARAKVELPRADSSRTQA
jgi:hypothetical protein